ncbi:bifunctional glyoxylate/hydroxypyruvate reductase B [Halomonas litopenaei]|uniref:D-glycerate dehydrogenase n=3 Tax=Halomonas TaxID=2745 RepID=A0AAU7KKK7_9GAMM|nr:MULTISPECIES: D-glycerate dehydrogenase [Halomonas]MBS8267536.1 D-glycerate dehydrogenase [Halomonas litopenaei]PTL90186.1 bifunctional glyoxylate/hydroxypyruvate reductase B [Halomonas sp. SYSU XM8]PTL95508.1 bifunctional glyoxylate/hydroxypyruvate reductase B [Halomonas litopenaei]
MTKRILVFREINQEQLDALREEFHVDYLPGVSHTEDPAFVDALSRAHGLVGSSLKITSSLLDRAPNLEAIASISVGYDNYPLDELTRRGILLCNTPDVLTETTADTGFLLIMSTARRAVELAELVKQGNWKESIGKPLYGSDVHGKTLGMVGMGRIGAAIARRGALGFGMKILYTKASPKPELERELGAQRRELEELLEQADFVCVTVPLSRETEKLFGAAEFQRMKPGAIFVNLARGKVVDEAAMIAALQDGTLHAAGLDVYEQEPLPADSPLPHMANVVALPHIGSATHETRTAMAQRAVDNIRLALKGERPLSPVNDEVLND